MWKKVLVPHDFSTCAAHALGLAADLARIHQASLVVLHVSPLPANVSPDALITPPGERTPVRVGEYVVRGAERELDRVAEPLLRDGLTVETLAVTGDVATEIVAASQTNGADVIVMGTHGREGLSHSMLGSVAERVIRRSPLPVVTVRWSRGHAEPTREERQVEDELAR
jgi:nucleotide-binding universal stress UspA family protein